MLLSSLIPLLLTGCVLLLLVRPLRRVSGLLLATLTALGLLRRFALLALITHL
jgi:hypothetical protein